MLCFKPKNLKNWQQCRDKAELSVNQREIGVLGVEAEINTKCGNPPAQEPEITTGLIRMHPYDVVRSKAWKNKFIKITKSKYTKFVERFIVASETQLEGEWITGQGLAPHMGGSEEAAFAINSETGETFGVMMENKNQFSMFGFHSPQAAPPFLQEWLTVHKK